MPVNLPPQLSSQVLHRALAAQDKPAASTGGGQTLQAYVKSVSAEASMIKVVLQLNQGSIDAISPIPVKAGDQLELEGDIAKGPLRIVSVNQLKPGATLQQHVEESLKNLAKRHGPAASLLSKLMSTVNASSLTGAPLNANSASKLSAESTLAAIKNLFNSSLNSKALSTQDGRNPSSPNNLSSATLTPAALTPAALTKEARGKTLSKAQILALNTVASVMANNAKFSTSTPATLSTQNITHNHLASLLQDVLTLSEIDQKKQSGKSAELIKNTLQNSGVFMENKLLGVSRQSLDSQLLDSDISVKLSRFIRYLESISNGGKAGAIEQHLTNPNPISDNPATRNRLQQLLQQATQNLGPWRSHNMGSQDPSLSTVSGLSHQALKHLTTALMQRESVSRPLPGNNSSTEETHSAQWKSTQWTPMPGLLSSHYIKAEAIAKKGKDDLGDAMAKVFLKLATAQLARVQLQQISLLPSMMNDAERTTAVPQSVNCDVTMLIGEQLSNLHVRIQEEEDQNDSTHDKSHQREKTWVVNLGFDVEPLGPMHVKLTLCEAIAKAQVWAEHQTTYRYTRGAVKKLKANLETIGITVDHIECLHGLPPATSSTINQRLVDVKT